MYAALHLILHKNDKVYKIGKSKKQQYYYDKHFWWNFQQM